MTDCSNDDRDSSLPPGATVYTRSALRFYDFLVHSISNRFVWRCRKSRLVEHIRRHVSDNHLEIGIASGKLFRKAVKDVDFRRLVIADVNQNCLDMAARQLQQKNPTNWKLNLIDPHEPLDQHAKFDSIGLNYVLHCLPCSLAEKMDICGLLVEKCLSEEGVLFGSTLLYGLNETWISRRLMDFYNRKQVFSNERDLEDDFAAGWVERNLNFEVEKQGCCCLFRIGRMS